eukprot:4247882-Amphidinium_carterae.1
MLQRLGLHLQEEGYLIFVSKGTTSFAQPLDRGYMRSFRSSEQLWIPLFSVRDRGKTMPQIWALLVCRSPDQSSTSGSSGPANDVEFPVRSSGDPGCRSLMHGCILCALCMLHCAPTWPSAPSGWSIAASVQHRALKAVG